MSTENLEEVPFRHVDGELQINWEWDNGEGDGTLADIKAELTQNLVEKKGLEWVEDNRERLDAEFEAIVVRGLLT